MKAFVSNICTILTFYGISIAQTGYPNPQINLPFGVTFVKVDSNGNCAGCYLSSYEVPYDSTNEPRRNITLKGKSVEHIRCFRLGEEYWISVKQMRLAYSNPKRIKLDGNEDEPCKAVTKEGKPCSRTTEHPSGFCWQHQGK